MKKNTNLLVVVTGLLWLGAVVALLLGVSKSVVVYGLLGLFGVGWCAVGYSAFCSRQPDPVTPVRDHGDESASLAKVCHELRTPLHNIIGLINILAREGANQTQRYYLQLVDEASQHLLSMINGVLDFSKADTSKLSLTKKTTQLDEVVRRALRTVAPQAYQKGGLELVCRFDPDVPLDVDTDGTRLSQVLINLLGNAIKFTSVGFVKLSVSMRRATDEARDTLLFEVIDTGAGIPSDELDAIFEPFSQVDMTIVRKASGTGLGLTIVKQLVTLLGGEVGVSSVLKEGSTFWFTLPLIQDGDCNANSSVSGVRDLHGKRVCVMSKGSVFTELVASTLTQSGATVEASNNPHKRLDQDTLADFYLIAEDLLASGNAEELLREFVDKDLQSSVAIFLSPNALRVRQLCEELGLPLVVSLPVLSKDILDVVAGTYRPTENESFAVGLSRASRSLHVLVADDMPTNQMILRSFLEDAGHCVTTVSDGDELVAYVKQYSGRSESGSDTGHFDLIMTDIEMPRMDGVSAIRTIREIEKERGCPSLPIIAITAHTFEEERSRILTAGANGIVTKPLRPRELDEVMCKVVGRVEERPEVAKPSQERKTTEFVECAQAVLSERVGTERKGWLDVRDLFERSGENPRRSLLILRSFMDCYERVLAELRQAERQQCATELSLVAHALKGLTADVGAKEIADEAANLENLGKEGRLTEILPLVPGLIADTEEVAAAIGSVLEAFPKE